MAFYTDKNDIQRSKDLLLRQPDMYVSEILYIGSGVVSIVGDDVTITPVTSPAWTINAFQSSVTLNIVMQDENDVACLGKVKSNAADAITFDATLARKITTGAVAAAADWTVGDTVNFYAMTPGTEYIYGDYFGIVKEPEMSWNEEFATVEDIDGLIAEGLIRVEMDITGQNKNCVKGDVLRSVLNLTAQGAQSGNVEYHGGFRPPTRNKFRVTYFGLTDDNKDFMLQYFMGRFRAEGSFAPTGEDYAQLGWGFRPQADTIRSEAVNAYRILIAT